MPLYLCQAGKGQTDPWRHGIPVYAEPFDTNQNNSNNSLKNNRNNPLTFSGTLLRRIRHAEVVLVDDVCIAFERFWLRLRWPGAKGGFAGYVAVSSAQQKKKNSKKGDDPQKNYSKTETGSKKEHEEEVSTTGQGGGGGAQANPNNAVIANNNSQTQNKQNDMETAEANAATAAGTGTDENTNDDQTKTAMALLAQTIQDQQKEDEEDDEEDEDVDDLPFLTSNDDYKDQDETIQGGVVVTCVRTGLPFGSTPTMKLMPLYDDGLHDLLPPIATITTKEDKEQAEGATTTSTQQDKKRKFIMDFSHREPVLCRICREGLHEDADDEQPSPAAEGDDGETNNNNNTRNNNNNNNAERNRARRSRLPSRRVTSNVSSEGAHSPTRGEQDGDEDILHNDNDNMESSDPNLVCQTISNTGPVDPPPHYTPNPHALENPLLAPCNCTGSMAFVHYLCVEQWRCRSRHPAAQNGLACETCGGLYSLPPPASRPAPQNSNNEAPDQDWLDAMPPHVIQALRQPHLLWQLGAAVVRRRWLRPLAPILVSPLVALYCRARRLLKKRGVARRRWACSLCRRRARWKCVRCLRSYYCSRQCQNVSWHIVHKHVCYKPIRTFWSVIVYGCLLLWAVPGILRDPLMYDLGLLIVPGSFLVIGVLAGGIATAFKKTAHVDLRGRMLELTVLVGTLWLSAVSWGLVQGFFGQSQACVGSLGRRQVIVTNQDMTEPTEDGGAPAAASFFATQLSSINNYNDGTEQEAQSGTLLLPFLWWLRTAILVPAKAYYLFWDRWAATSPPWIRSLLCVVKDSLTGSTDDNNNNTNATLSIGQEESDQQHGCFEFLPHANADFFISKVMETPTSSSIDLDGSNSNDTSTLLPTETDENLILGPSKCAADLMLVTWLYFLAALAYVGSALYKYQERRQRRLMQNQRRQQQVLQLRLQQAQLQAAVAAQPRPHQD